MMAMKPRIPVSTLVDLATGRLEPEEASFVLDQVERDPAASATLESAIALVELTSQEGPSVFAQPGSDGFLGRLVAPVAGWWTDLWSRPVVQPAAAGMAVCMVVLLVVLASYPPVSEAEREACIRDEEVMFLVRGPSDREIDIALYYLAAGRGQEAAEVLEWFLRAFPESQSTVNAHYLAGIAWLMTARSEVLGVYSTIDERAVGRALAHFALAAGVGSNDRLGTQVEWYTARAYVMVRDQGRARALLERIARAGGGNATAARALLELLPLSPREDSGPQ